jgi:hypothetical protein
MDVSRRRNIPQALRKAIWEVFKTPENVVICHHCSAKLDSFNFECGHIQSVAEGGPTTFDNLVPVCSTCNKSVGKRNIHAFNAQYFPDREQKMPENLVATLQEMETSSVVGLCVICMERPRALKKKGHGYGQRCEECAKKNQESYRKSHQKRLLRTQPRPQAPN